MYIHTCMYTQIALWGATISRFAIPEMGRSHLKKKPICLGIKPYFCEVFFQKRPAILAYSRFPECSVSFEK